MISWFKVDPALEMAKLTIINGMNHVLKASEADRMKNIAIYNQPDLPIKPELVEAITAFVRVTVPDERE